jgi:hypothetical protein
MDKAAFRRRFGITDGCCGCSMYVVWAQGAPVRHRGRQHSPDIYDGKRKLTFVLAGSMRRN